MGQFSAMKLTKLGLNLQSQVQTSKILNFTKIVVGTGYVPKGTEIPNITKLVKPQSDADINIIGNEIIGDGTTNLKVVVKSGKTSFYMREIGVYAKVDDGDEILYSYANAGEYADFVPSIGGATEVVQELNLITVIGNTENVTANITVEIDIPMAENLRHSKIIGTIDTISYNPYATEEFNQFNVYFEKIVWAGDKYIGLTQSDLNGYVRTSYDFEKWWAVGDTKFDPLHPDVSIPADIAYGNGTTIITTRNSEIFLSYDGINCIETSYLGCPSNSFINYVYDMFILYPKVADCPIAYSFDGAYWQFDTTLKGTKDNESFSTLYVGGIYYMYIANKIYKSSNILTEGWTLITTLNSDISDVCYLNNSFYAIKDGNIVKSINNKIWNVFNSSKTFTDLRSFLNCLYTISYKANNTYYFEINGVVETTFKETNVYNMLCLYDKIVINYRDNIQNELISIYQTTHFNIPAQHIQRHNVTNAINSISSFIGSKPFNSKFSLNKVTISNCYLTFLNFYSEIVEKFSPSVPIEDWPCPSLGEYNKDGTINSVNMHYWFIYDNYINIYEKVISNTGNVQLVSSGYNIYGLPAEPDEGNQENLNVPWFCYTGMIISIGYNSFFVTHEFSRRAYIVNSSRKTVSSSNYLDFSSLLTIPTSSTNFYFDSNTVVCGNYIAVPFNYHEGNNMVTTLIYHECSKNPSIIGNWKKCTTNKGLSNIQYINNSFYASSTQGMCVAKDTLTSGKLEFKSITIDGTASTSYFSKIILMDETYYMLTSNKLSSSLDGVNFYTVEITNTIKPFFNDIILYKCLDKNYILGIIVNSTDSSVTVYISENGSNWNIANRYVGTEVLGFSNGYQINDTAYIFDVGGEVDIINTINSVQPYNDTLTTVNQTLIGSINELNSKL